MYNFPLKTPNISATFLHFSAHLATFLHFAGRRGLPAAKQENSKKGSRWMLRERREAVGRGPPRARAGVSRVAHARTLRTLRSRPCPRPRKILLAIIIIYKGVSHSVS